VTQFFQYIVVGLANGGVYATLALALVLIHRATGIVNFAQGEMGMFCTFIAWALITHHGVPYWTAFFLTLLIGSLVSRCEGSGRRDRGAARGEPADDAPYQAEVDEGVGAAVAILVDTSGSMKEPAPGDSRPKYVVAREALGTSRKVVMPLLEYLAANGHTRRVDDGRHVVTGR